MNRSLAKALTLLEAIIEDNGGQSLQAISEVQGIPLPTAFRLVRTLMDQEYLIQGKRGRYFAGSRLHDLASKFSSVRTTTGVSRPILDRLARRFQCVCHFGVFEGDMVTYLVRSGAEDADFTTQECTQLEAYCSAIGKMLLAELPFEERELYLSKGQFISLTKRTIVDPSLLRENLSKAKDDGYAIDDREIYDSLFCIAVPLHDADRNTLGAISLSMAGIVPNEIQIQNRVLALTNAAIKIQDLMT